MQNGTLVAGQGVVADRIFRTRAMAAMAAVALVLAMTVLVQHRADASPHASVAAAVAVPVAAQIPSNQFVCPILLAVRNAFAGLPFFSFVAAALDPIIASFGCPVIS